MVWYILYLYSMVYHILWYITVWYIPLMWYNMVYTIQVLWYHSCISQLVYHTCDMEHFVCDIPCYITKIGIYHLWYTNHDWYIPVMVGISHDPTFQMFRVPLGAHLQVAQVILGNIELNITQYLIEYWTRYYPILHVILSNID